MMFNDRQLKTLRALVRKEAKGLGWDPHFILAPEKRQRMPRRLKELLAIYNKLDRELRARTYASEPMMQRDV